jgi:hypothetical protein
VSAVISSRVQPSPVPGEPGEEPLAEDLGDERGLVDPLQRMLERLGDRQIRREGAAHRRPLRETAVVAVEPIDPVDQRQAFGRAARRRRPRG